MEFTKSLRLVLIGSAMAVFAQFACAQFPDGPGKDTTVKACSGCHEPDRATYLHLDKSGWEDIVGNMMGMGLTLSDSDYNQIINYLSTSFPPMINVNTAKADDISKILALTPDQAAAIVAYRDKNGKFAKLDDLKKVPGLDAAKIDAKKNSIAF